MLHLRFHDYYCNQQYHKSVQKTLIKHVNHHAADAELLMMMQTSSNSDREFITSTIQTFKYVFTIEEKIWKTMRKEMITDASSIILLNSQTLWNQRMMMRFVYLTLRNFECKALCNIFNLDYISFCQCF